jgi:hypothetical protein
VNLCRPDDSKSCAACCGLYNVPDATRETLEKRLETRTSLFRHTERSVDAIEDYKILVAREEAVQPLEPVIHVCEFTGFLDAHHRVVGCQLHPSAEGNLGVDWRGLCHYGSMACKAFFCPAWDEIPVRYLEIVAGTISDWHLYGLVVTDVDYVRALFALIESALGSPVRNHALHISPAAKILEEMLSWKNTWPFAGPSRFRKNRYYFKGSDWTPEAPVEQHLEYFLQCLRFTFSSENTAPRGEELVRHKLAEFVKAYLLR